MFSYEEPTPEKTKELIEKVAKFIVDRDMGTAAILFIETAKPMSFVGGQMARFFIGPYMPLFGGLGDTTYDLAAIFEKRENMEQLLLRIEALMEEKSELEKAEKTKEEKGKSFFSSLISKFKRS